MTPTISPVTGALPQQPAPTTTNCATPPPPLAGAPAAIASAPAAAGVAPSTTTPTTATGGGSLQAVQGAAPLQPEQLVPVLQQLVGVLGQLVTVLQQQGGVTGGGAPGQVPGQVGGGCGCGMPGCAHGAPTQGGAMGAPSAAGSSGAPSGRSSGAGSGNGGRSSAPSSGSPESNAPSTVARVNPSSVKDKTGTGGLTPASVRGLEEAHTFGLPLVSGKRSGGGASDHDHGNAIDVGTLPIGSPSSSQGTPQMQAFAEHMRQQGKAGKLDVKYVIADGKIASARDGWAWRPYTYPGKSTAELEALKRSNPGEYNRLQHNDHVHVSFG